MGWTKRNVERIGKLTPSQEGKLPFFRDKWTRIAASTEPFDCDIAAEGIERFAEALGVKGFCDQVYTTQSGSMGAGWHHGGFHYTTDLLNSNFSELERSPWGTRCMITRAFLPSVVRVVEEMIQRNFVSPLSLVRLAPPQEPGKHRHYFTYGQVDASWLAVADFFATVFDNEDCKKLSGLMQAVSSTGYIWIRPDKVIFCDRPEISKYDDRGRPHCEDGPALKYRDGFTHYAIHGIAVPEKYITTPANQIDFADLIQEPNAAVRMAVIEKFGFRRLMDTVKYKRISTADGNSLVEFRLPKPENSTEYGDRGLDSGPCI